VDNKETSARNTAFRWAMQDAKTYRQYAEDCLKLARQQPQHRARLEEMAAVWTDLAEKAEGRKKDQAKQQKEPK
jgi:ferric-dicitrate binding protein FerR (iron transport regulator)